MFQKIVIPLDGSEFAEMVLAHLARVAIQSDTQLVLVGVVETMRYISSRHAPLELLTIVRQQYKAYLQDLSARLRAAGYGVESIVAEGDAATEILRTARNSGAELIAMTTRGRSGVTRWMLGSVAERVLQGATLPVLLVGDRQSTVQQGEGLRRLLVPLDGSRLAEQALPYAQQLAQTTGAEILLLQSVLTTDAALGVSQPSHGAEIGSVQEREVASAQDYLAKVAQRLNSAGVRCRTEVAQDEPYEAIYHAARRGRVELVIMTTRGASNVKRWLLGSVASKVLRNAPCPVMAVPAKSEPA